MRWRKRNRRSSRIYVKVRMCGEGEVRTRIYRKVRKMKSKKRRSRRIYGKMRTVK